MLVSGKTLFAFSNILSHLSAYCCFAWDHYSLPEQPKYHSEWVFMVSFISSITSLLVATGKLLANSYLDIESPRLFSRHLWWRFYVFLFIYDYLPNGHRYQQYYQLLWKLSLWLLLVLWARNSFWRFSLTNCFITNFFFDATF